MKIKTELEIYNQVKDNFPNNSIENKWVAVDDVRILSKEFQHIIDLYNKPRGYGKHIEADRKLIMLRSKITQLD